MHFVYRVPYNQPNKKFYREFKEEKIIEWFKNFWKFYSDSEDEFQERIFKEVGVNIYGFWGVTRRWVEEGKDYFQIVNKNPPKNQKEIIEYLDNGYCNEIDFVNENALEVATDDDECDLAYYIFTDQYVKNNPEKCSYLIYPKWNLPESFSQKSNFKEKLSFPIKTYKKNIEKQGTTYIAIFSKFGGGLRNEDLIEKVVKIEGIRINELNDFLKSPESVKICYWDLFFLRTQIENNSIKDTILNYSKIPEFYIKVYAHSNSFDMKKVFDPNIKIGKKYIEDYYAANKEIIHNLLKSNYRAYPEEKLDKSKFQFSKHMIQASIHTETWKTHPVFDAGKNNPLFHHWIIFDDLWASENSNLANSILNFAGKWDVLK